MKTCQKKIHRRLVKSCPGCFKAGKHKIMKQKKRKNTKLLFLIKKNEDKDEEKRMRTR